MNNLFKFISCIKLQNLNGQCIVKMSVTSLEMHSKVPYSLPEIYPAPFCISFRYHVCLKHVCYENLFILYNFNNYLIFIAEK